ncbi:MAG: 16S rRNA (cytosine(1402)-N(4))-methyltransferase RsmH [Paludibacteraceae bacterium]|nr:16S rRNA (cytosine(1402)-N(4))-methyltransferase RsmH [Paludibacteraceae bacterium]
MADQPYHIPALLKESIDGLDIKPDGIYVDVTFGGGGHTREILRRLSEKGRLFVFDQDAEAMVNLPDDDRVTFIHANFRFLYNNLKYEFVKAGLGLTDGVPLVDGIIADLGVSFHDFDTAYRGFSFRFDAPLDMRMNTEARLTASEIVNTYTKEKLRDLLYVYGEVKNANSVVYKIMKARGAAPIETVKQLLTAIGCPFTEADGLIEVRPNDKKELSRIFQALRMEVHGEMDALNEMLTQTSQVIRPGGRLSVITYHSLEDRMVKNYMKNGQTMGECEKDQFGNLLSAFRPVNNKPIVAGEDEVNANPRSRSAKLRLGERTTL